MSAEPPRATVLDREIARLTVPRRPLGLPHPVYEGRSLPNVASTVVRALGGDRPPLALPTLAAELDPFDGGRADGPVLLFVVDGLGLLRLREAARDGPGARNWLEHARPITSVFPSTTTCALVSLATAASPSRHGIVGYRQYLPRAGTVVDVLRMTPTTAQGLDTLAGPDWDPSTVVGAPTIYRGPLAGSIAVSRDVFEGKAFSRLLYDGTRYAAYATYSDLAGVLVQLLSRRRPPGLLVAYWDELDAVQHLRGPASPSFDLEIERLAALLAHVARHVPEPVARRTTVVVTADHGHLPTVPALQRSFDAIPAIARRLARPPTGDRRVGLLKARSGEIPSLRSAVLRALPRGARVLDAEAAISAGLFGPPPFHPELHERIGDLVALVPSPGGITYRWPGHPPSTRELQGGHGGLEAPELIVPLITGRLPVFARARP